MTPCVSAVAVGTRSLAADIRLDARALAVMTNINSWDTPLVGAKNCRGEWLKQLDHSPQQEFIAQFVRFVLATRIFHLVVRPSQVR